MSPPHVYIRGYTTWRAILVFPHNRWERKKDVSGVCWCWCDLTPAMTPDGAVHHPVPGWDDPVRLNPEGSRAGWQTTGPAGGPPRDSLPQVPPPLQPQWVDLPHAKWQEISNVVNMLKWRLLTSKVKPCVECWGSVPWNKLYLISCGNYLYCFTECNCRV